MPTKRNPRALTSTQERRLVDFLDERFLEINRHYKKRSEPTTILPTLSSYLKANRQVLSLILQIPPVDPSASLRTQLLLHLTNEVLTSIPGYEPDPQVLPELVDWLDDLDQSWVAVLQSQVWDPALGEGVDLIIDSDNDGSNTRSSPVSQTERTRLRSLLVGGESSLEEWLAGMDIGSGVDEDLQAVLEKLGLQDAFDELFHRTLEEIGGLAGLVNDPAGKMGTC